MNYQDVAVHAVAATIFVAIGSLLALFIPANWALATVNALAWPAREAAQRLERGDVWWQFSRQNIAEAVAPAAAGFVIAAII